MSIKITRPVRRAAAVLVFALAAAATAADWPQFRGPALDGISHETGLLPDWPDDGPAVVWRAPLGEGYSGVSVVGDRLFTMYADGQDELVVSLEAGGGQERWRYRLGARWRDMMGNGPRSTPTVSDGVVYALGAHGNLAALEADSGDEIWKRDLKETIGARPPTWGVSTSPLVEGKLLILDAGGKSGHSVIAINRADGALVWHAESDKAGYAMPLTLSLGEQRQVVLFTGTQVLGVDPADGRVLWKRPWKTAYDVNAATPIFVAPDRLFVASGYNTGAAMLRLDVAGEATRVSEVWTNAKMRNQFSTSIYHEGHIYGFDNATLKCLDAGTGEEKWAVREGFGHGSLAYADGHFYVLGDRGKLALVEATPEAYREKAAFQALAGKCWTVPTLADGRLYVRNEKELLALDVRKPAS